MIYFVCILCYFVCFENTKYQIDVKSIKSITI